MIISMDKYQNTFEYQDTMEVDVKNIAKNKTIWGPIYEVFYESFFGETNISQKLF